MATNRVFGKLFTSGLLAVASYPTMCFAQVAAQSDATPPNSGVGPVGTGPADDLEEGAIVVTAQRREQRLTDVPLSVTASSAADLARANISSTRDLMLVTPALTLQSTGPWLQPAIRGVTSQATAPGSEQNVAIYVDGVYQPFAASNSFELPDVERVEVLKGPQGTLFGRNATGGAIQIITREPSFTTTTGQLYGSYGRYHDTELTGYINMPASDKIAISLSGSHRSTGGWVHNLLDEGRYIGSVNSDIGRAKVLIKLSDTAKVEMTGFYSRRNDNQTQLGSILNGNGAATLAGLTPIATKPNTAAQDYPSKAQTKNWGFSLRGTLDTSVGTITSTSAYIGNRFHLQTDIDASIGRFLYTNLYEPINTYSQELLFASEKFGRFSFVAGGYAYYSQSGYDPRIDVFSQGRIVQTQQARTRSTSYAGFAEGTFEITDKLSIIGGARYTWERRKLINNFATTPRISQGSFDRITPRASAIYKLAENTNVYFTYSQGFKSGQYEVSQSVNLIQPEYLYSYEVGFKTSNRTFSLNAAGFYADYDNLQVQYLNPVNNIGSLQNAGSARIYGGEVSLRARITPEFSATLQGAYTHANYVTFTNASVTIPRFVNGVQAGNQTVSRNLSGRPLARAPRVSGNLALNYDRQFSNGKFDLSGVFYYSSSYGIENSLRVKQPKYVQINANIGWTFGDTGLRVGAYVKNLTDRVIFSQASFGSTADNVVYQEPRNYGISAKYSF